MLQLSLRADRISARLAAPLTLFSIAASALGCAPLASEPAIGSSAEEVVYGVDNRLEYYEASAAWQAITDQSIVALLDAAQLAGGGPYRLDETSFTLTQSVASPNVCGEPLCGGESFSSQPTASWCSGTLIDDDLVLTAGHCVDPGEPFATPCAQIRFVFDYYYASPGSLETITTDDVYSCAEIVAYENTGTMDYGVVRLDRPVTGGRQPATMRPGAAALSEGSGLNIIGFGSGLPAKIDGGGIVTDNRSANLDYFSGSVDAFGGNSGSGVFNDAGELAGILVRGATDYNDVGSCCEVNTLPDPVAGAFAGEGITYAFNAIDALCATPEGDGRDLCQGWCSSCTTVADCPMGWGCRSDPAIEDVSWCAPGCSTDADCRDDHTCSGAGFCVPERLLGCSDGDVWTLDACNNPLAEVEVCPESNCLGGVCGGGIGAPKSKGCDAAGAPFSEPGLLLTILGASLVIWTRRRRLV